jgi:hypothetical protein
MIFTAVHSHMELVPLAMQFVQLVYRSVRNLIIPFGSRDWHVSF